ncbi:MAG: MFS transporter [Nitrospirae bacterium]|jgi:MFS family permease|nr:MFS transporter [Nitrospirota bacterium]
MLSSKSFSSLSFRDYRLFWLGQLISLSGTWMQSVAQSWLVYQLTKSPFYLGAVAAAGTLPILLFTLGGGIIADRFRKRNLLLLTQALSIIPALLLGILTDFEMIKVWQVAVLAAILGTINAFDIPARQSFMSELVSKDSLTNAIALNSAAFHGARMVGPVIAGIAIARIGLPACFYLNGLSFLAVIIALSMIKTMGEKHKTTASISKSFIEGLQFIKRQTDILGLIIMITIFSLIAMPFITLLPVFAAEIFKKGAEGFGLLVGATGAGALSAALFLAFKGDIRDKTKFMSFSAFCISLPLLVFSLSNNFHLSAFTLYLTGFGLVSFLATANSFIQLSSPDNLRGRAMSVYTFVFLGTAPIGNALIGTIADLIGASKAINISAVICIIASIAYCMKICRK